MKSQMSQELWAGTKRDAHKKAVGKNSSSKWPLRDQVLKIERAGANSRRKGFLGN